MAHTYGFLKCTIDSNIHLQSSGHGNETQYHLHANVNGAGGEQWDIAVNVGTDQGSDLLRYRLVNNFAHSIINELRAAGPGFSDQTGNSALPALDFLRSNILDNTGTWQDSDVMDGQMDKQPLHDLDQVLRQAMQNQADVYIFGRTYTGGDLGIHDVHMNQGSSKRFINNGRDDHNDHNDIWQDGAVIVDFGDANVTAYFTAFTQQKVPTDNLGNPSPHAHGIEDADDGSLIPAGAGA